jgi:hypothetical protein
VKPQEAGRSDLEDFPEILTVVSAGVAARGQLV